MGHAFNTISQGDFRISDKQFKQFIERKGFYCSKEDKRSLVRLVDFNRDG